MIQTKRLLPGEDFFREEYVKKNRSIKEIAAELGFDPRAVWQKIMRLNLLKRKGNRRLELLGRKFGELSVISFVGVTRGKTMWMCECSCGHIGTYVGHHLTEGAKRSCGCANKKKPFGSKNPLWTGYGEISGSFWSKLKEQSKKRKFEVTIEHIWDLFLKQNRRCALSGVKLSFGSSYSKIETTASLDRIDSSDGYIVGNIQWVHKVVNKMKTDLPQDVFLYWCNRIAKNLEAVK